MRGAITVTPERPTRGELLRLLLGVTTDQIFSTLPNYREITDQKTLEAGNPEPRPSLYSTRTRMGATDLVSESRDARSSAKTPRTHPTQNHHLAH